MRPIPVIWACALLVSLAMAPSPATGDSPTSGASLSEREAALEFLRAVASGDPEVVALTIHPDDLKTLRLRLLTQLREEAKRHDNTLRVRLFGEARSLEEIEHLTDTGFYATLADRLYLPGRDYESVDGLATVPDKDGKINVLVRGHQPRDRGKVQVVNFVTLRPYGKGWKAALPSELEAQIDDLLAGRHSSSAEERSTAALRGGRGTAPAQPGIVTLLTTSEQLLTDGKCADYYGKELSPNFRLVTGKKALAALVAACEHSFGTREMLLSTLHIVKGLEPRYDFEGQRAIYDLSGQGLPFDHFVLEQVDKRWYVAE